MENKKVTGKMIICTINGKEREVQVRKHAPYTVRKTTAEFIASQVMDSDGKYSPWKQSILMGMFVIVNYTDFELPENWKDNEISVFMQGESYRKIRESVDLPELIDDLVAYRKTCYARNSFDRAIEALTTVVQSLASIGSEAMKFAGDNPDLMKNLNLTDIIALMLDAMGGNENQNEESRQDVESVPAGENTDEADENADS